MRSIKRFIPASFVVLWATGFIGARYAMPWAEPFTFLSVRFVLAAILLAVLTTVLGSRKASRAEALQKSIPPYQLRSKGFSRCLAGGLLRAQPFPAADA